MADRGEIIIRFTQGDAETPSPDAEPVNTTGEKQVQSSTSNMFRTGFFLYAAKKAYSGAKQITINEAKYQLNKYFRLTDNYLGQQNMNIALGIVNRVANFGLSVASGFMIGGIPGAIVTAGIDITKNILEIAHNYEQENINLQKMDNQLQFNRQRAGYSLTSGSIGENK